MNVVDNRIPPEFFDRMRRVAAEERARALSAFVAGLEVKLRRLFHPRQRFADIHFRFHGRGLWRGI